MKNNMDIRLRIKEGFCHETHGRNLILLEEGDSETEKSYKLFFGEKVPDECNVLRVKVYIAEEFIRFHYRFGADTRFTCVVFNDHELFIVYDYVIALLSLLDKEGALHRLEELGERKVERPRPERQKRRF